MVESPVVEITGDCGHRQAAIALAGHLGLFRQRSVIMDFNSMPLRWLSRPGD
jgi:hypothetical protein